MEKFDAKELEGALIFVSCETTDIDDAEEIYERNFPFTFRGNELVCFEVSPDDVNEEFDMSEYDEEHRGTYDVEAYCSLQELADEILTVEGEEYVKAFYYGQRRADYVLNRRGKRTYLRFLRNRRCNNRLQWA